MALRQGLVIVCNGISDGDDVDDDGDFSSLMENHSSKLCAHLVIVGSRILIELSNWFAD